jgi:membrane-bound inhibitor of C-type lysozyme
LLLLALSATACKKSEAPAESGADAAATPAAATPAAATSAAAPGFVDAGTPETKYRCSTGIVPVSYKADGTVTIKHNDKVLELKADAANADRYTGSNLEWWVNGRGQGATANLYTQTPEGTAGDLLEGCVENPQA